MILLALFIKLAIQANKEWQLYKDPLPNPEKIALAISATERVKAWIIRSTKIGLCTPELHP